MPALREATDIPEPTLMAPLFSGVIVLFGLNRRRSRSGRPE
jgi:hypothetical protein